MSDHYQKLADAFAESFEVWLRNRPVPFQEAVPVEATLAVIKHARTNGWTWEKIGNLENSTIYRFMPPGWTDEKAALLAQVEGAAA